MAEDEQKPIRLRRPRAVGVERPWSAWLSEPRAAVLMVLFLIVLVGGGRKLLRGWRGRTVLGRLGAADVSAGDVAAVVEFGREGLMELFRLLATAESATVRTAAGHALSVLWARDELIAEEEQAIVRRGFEVAWHARRRYPRALRGPIPMAVDYCVPFLSEEGGGIAPANLEWSHTILGARRAGLEVASPWQAGPGRAGFSLVPEDFDTNGPHRLVLKTRVRTCGLSAPWEVELPQMPLSFEFDPRLSVDALFALADAARGEAIGGAVRLAAGDSGTEAFHAFLPLNATMAVRNLPVIAVSLPLPCDLAHMIALEVDGVAGRFAAGELVLSGQGERSSASGVQSFPLGAVAPLPVEAIERPGRYRIRAILEPNADRGWADPDIRSIWPEPIATEWVDVEVVRR
jgi:hypothetical protein